MLVPIVAAGTDLWLSTRDLSRYQARLTEQVRKVTGRELAARVPLTVQLGREPALVAEGVTLTQCAVGSRPGARARAPHHDVSRSVLAVSGRSQGRPRAARRRRHPRRAQRGGRRQPRDAAAARRLGAARRREPLAARCVANPAFPWIGTIEVRNSVLTVAEGAGRPPVVLEVAQRHASSRRRPTSRCRSTASFARTAGRRRSSSPARPARSTAGCAACPATSTCRAASAAARSRSRAASASRAPACRSPARGRTSRSSAPTSACRCRAGGPYALNAKAGDPAQRLQGRGAVAQGRGISELTRRGAVPRRSQRHADRRGEHRRRQDRPRRACKAPPAPAGRPGTPPPQRRFLPSTPFQASWLGRSTFSVTARVGEVTGLRGKITNGSVTLASSETRFAFRGAASIGSGLGGLRPGLRSGRPDRPGDADGHREQGRSMDRSRRLLGLDLGLKDAVGDIDLRLRGGGRIDGERAQCGERRRSTSRSPRASGRATGWPAGRPRSQRLLGGERQRRAVQLHRRPLRGERRRRQPAPPGGRHAARDHGRRRLLHRCATRAGRFILAPEARDAQGAQLASPLRIKGGTGQPTAGALEPGLTKLLIGGGVVPSLTGTLTRSRASPTSMPAPPWRLGSRACGPACAPSCRRRRPSVRRPAPRRTASARRSRSRRARR